MMEIIHALHESLSLVGRLFFFLFFFFWGGGRGVALFSGQSNCPSKFLCMSLSVPIATKGRYLFVSMVSSVGRGGLAIGAVV